MNEIELIYEINRMNQELINKDIRCNINYKDGHVAVLEGKIQSISVSLLCKGVIFEGDFKVTFRKQLHNNMYAIDLRAIENIDACIIQIVEVDDKLIDKIDLLFEEIYYHSVSGEKIWDKVKPMFHDKFMEIIKTHTKGD